jgi:integrase
MRWIKKGCHFDGVRYAYLEVTVPGTKTRRRKKVECSSRAEAERLHDEFRKQIINPASSVLPLTEVPTFSAYLERYGMPGHLSSKVRKDQALALRAVLPAIGHLRLGRIGFADLEALQSRLKGSPHTINQKFGIIRKVLKHARKAKIISELPEFPESLPTKQYKLQIDDTDIFEKFLPAFDDPRLRSDKPFFVVATYTGLALSDLLTLRWTDIHGDVIRRTRNKTDVVATIPLNSVTLSALEEVRSDSEFVFHTSRATVRRRFKSAKELAKITKRFRFHDLRHAFCTRLGNRGLDAFLLMNAAGHANIRTSQRYLHKVNEDGLERMRKAIGQS